MSDNEQYELDVLLSVLRKEVRDTSGYQLFMTNSFNIKMYKQRYVTDMIT